MGYFRTRDIAGITVFASLWGVLNSMISPVFFQLFNLPFLCDLIGFASLILAVWYVRKVGTATLVGFIATVLNFILTPWAIHFLGFTASSIVFDFLAFLVGYSRLFQSKAPGSLILFSISVFCSATAGWIIGVFFMPAPSLHRWGGILAWAGLHAIGGVLGGAIGVSVVNALPLRGITPRTVEISR